MNIGAHVSAAGGIWNAGTNGKKLDCETIQIFSRPPQGGKAKPITDEVVRQFKEAMKKNNITNVYIHAPYFINLASDNLKIRENSISILREELERGSALGCKAMMFHPGSAKKLGREEGTKKIIEGLNKIMKNYRGSCQLLIEISAGAGEIMGDTFEEIATFIKSAKRGKNIGVCFDTQHAFASGYDLRTKKEINKTLKHFDEAIGLKKLIVIHANDSKVELNSHKDRHEHIGKGKIGKNAFKYLITHSRLQNKDFILETPYDDEPDPRGKDIKLLKSFRKK